MSRCASERNKAIFYSHEAALQTIVNIAFDPEREARGQTTPRSTYVCPWAFIPHWHLTHYENTSGWEIPEHRR